MASEKSMAVVGICPKTNRPKIKVSIFEEFVTDLVGKGIGPIFIGSQNVRIFVERSTENRRAVQIRIVPAGGAIFETDPGMQPGGFENNVKRLAKSAAVVTAVFEDEVPADGEIDFTRAKFEIRFEEVLLTRPFWLGQSGGNAPMIYFGIADSEHQTLSSIAQFALKPDSVVTLGAFSRFNVAALPVTGSPKSRTVRITPAEGAKLYSVCPMAVGADLAPSFEILGVEFVAELDEAGTKFVFSQFCEIHVPLTILRAPASEAA